MKPEASIPARGAAKSGPNTAHGSTDRGTPVSGPQNSIQADDDLNSRHWLKWDTIARIITGCQCGFRADIDSDCGFGDSVVKHLLEVGAEAAVPDVDGWFLRPSGRTDVALCHDSDHMKLWGEDLPVGAVLAFIADQGGRADEC